MLTPDLAAFRELWQQASSEPPSTNTGAFTCQAAALFGAAAATHATAQLQLGVAYQYGIGVRQDPAGIHLIFATATLYLCSLCWCWCCVAGVYGLQVLMLQRRVFAVGLLETLVLTQACVADNAGVCGRDPEAFHCFLRAASQGSSEVLNPPTDSPCNVQH